MEHMKYVVYQIRCKRTDKIYIGKHQTTNVDDEYMGSGKLLLHAVKKHGVENFEKTILHVFDNEADMNSKEAELVTEEFCDRKDTYNLCPGGKGGWGFVNAKGLAAGGDHSSTGRKGATGDGGRVALSTRWKNDRERMIEISKEASSRSARSLGKKYKQKNHNPASHPKGPRGPYKKRTLPL
jgi:hypothetical protein